MSEMLGYGSMSPSLVLQKKGMGLQLFLIVQYSRLPASALIEVGSDHRLVDPESPKRMLEACEGVNAFLNEPTCG